MSFRNLIILAVLALPSFANAAGFQCFTWSNEIVFKAVGADEAQTTNAVIAGCIDYDYTTPLECKNNVKCFPNNDPALSAIPDLSWAHSLQRKLRDAIKFPGDRCGFDSDCGIDEQCDAGTCDSCFPACRFDSDCPSHADGSTGMCMGTGCQASCM